MKHLVQSKIWVKNKKLHYETYRSVKRSNETFSTQKSLNETFWPKYTFSEIYKSSEEKIYFFILRTILLEI